LWGVASVVSILGRVYFFPTEAILKKEIARSEYCILKEEKNMYE